MEEQMLHCPRCGHLVHADDWFCDTCGLPLKRERMEHLDRFIGPELFDDDFEFAPRRRPRLRRRRRLGLLTLSAVAIVVIGGYAGGKAYFSKSATLERILADPSQQSNSVTKDGNELSSQQRQILKSKLKNQHNVFELHHHNRIGDVITYQKTGHRWIGFDRYQLVVDQNKINPAKKIKRFKPSSGTKFQATERQQITQLLQRLWIGMNHLTANGKVRQDLASYFVSGKNNNTYQHLNQMALGFYHANYDVRYRTKLQKINGYRQVSIKFNLTYLFYSKHHVHVQNFHWQANLVKHHRQYIIESAIGDLKPFQDQVLKR